MMDTPIRNMSDLRNEISRLKEKEQEQSVALAQRFNGPSAIFSTIYSLFSGSRDGVKTGFFDQDLVGLISRLVLPFTLNKTLFRNSGFIVKAIVGLVSQKASHFISEESLTNLWDKAKSVVAGFTKKTEEDIPDHKGVPAFSETY